MHVTKESVLDLDINDNPSTLQTHKDSPKIIDI